MNDRRALLLEGLDEEGAATNLCASRHRIPRLEALTLVANDRLNDVLRQDEELLQLGQHVRDGLVVGDNERRSVGRFELGGVRDERRHHGRWSTTVLDDEVAGKGGVGSGDRLAVRPLAVGLDLEGPDLTVARGRPRVGPVTNDLVVLVILHQRRVGLGPEDVGKGGKAHERIDRVRIRDRAEAEDATFLDCTSIRATGRAPAATWRGRCAAATGRKKRDHSDQDDAYE